MVERPTSVKRYHLFVFQNNEWEYRNSFLTRNELLLALVSCDRAKLEYEFFAW